MATIELSGLASTDTGAPSGWARTGRVYVKTAEIDIEDAIAAKGSALAQGDIIEAVSVPADSLILGGGIEVTAAMTGTSTDTTLDVGVTGGTADALVDGFDFDGASVGAASLANPMEIQRVSANDTVDILIATQTGTILTGKIRVFVLVAESSADITKAPGIAALGS